MFKLTADYHTHTVFSHGKGKIIDNAIIAKERGLIDLGITDHGFAHPAFGLRDGKLSKMRSLCDESKKETGVNVLLGIESNITGVDGSVDLNAKNYDKFDLFLAGFHKFVLYKFKSIFSFAAPNIWHSMIKSEKIPASVIKETTKTFINVIKNNPVDIITHLNFCCFADVVEVAKAAADYGTYLEINSKKTHLTDEDITKILDTDVRFVVNSDAHAPTRVGEVSLGKELIERTSIPVDRIMNVNGRLPDLRFKSFKEGRR